MARSNEFTHGGGVGKNIGLMLRAILNLLSFGLLWFGLFQLGADEVLFGLPDTVPLICTIAGAALTLLFLVVNLIAPWRHRKH